jgi:hypothetical protein
MASGYKLRLGDGTTVLLDDKGLATWLQGGLVDQKARVQPAGSKQWLTIRQLMVAMERATRERQVQQERHAAERRSAEERAEAERHVAEERAEAERRAAEERAALERLAEERLAAERLAAEEQAAREIRAERERLAAERRSARERADAERRAEEERAARARREPEPSEDDLETLDVELEPLPEAVPEEALPEAELEEPVVSAADLGLVPVEWPDADERPEPLPPPAARRERPPHPAPTFRVQEGRATSLFETLRPGLFATAERVRSLARWPRPAAAPRPVLAAPLGEMPATFAVPPPSLRDLPVIPLAAMAEPAEADVWEGGWLANLRATFLESRAGQIAPVLWVWCKRVTVTAAVLVIAALLASNTSVWLPPTTEVGIALFGQVDKLKARVAPSTMPPAAIAAASEQLPYLRTETIELIMISSAPRALAPPQLFRLAGDAVERGRAALGQPAAAELDRLTEALTAELPRAERTRLGEYLKRVRARAVTAPFEDQEAVWLMARAARRLPADRLSRLQELFARGVALGLQPTASASE